MKERREGKRRQWKAKERICLLCNAPPPPTGQHATVVATCCLLLLRIRFLFVFILERENILLNLNLISYHFFVIHFLIFKEKGKEGKGKKEERENRDSFYRSIVEEKTRGVCRKNRKKERENYLALLGLKRERGKGRSR